MAGYIIATGSLTALLLDGRSENALEVRQGPLLDVVARMAWAVERRNGVRWHDHVVIAIPQVGCGVHDADIGADPNQRDLLGIGGFEPRFQVGFEERRVAPLADQGGVFQEWLQFGHDLGLRGSPHAMDGEDLELSILWIVGIRGKKDLVAGMDAGFDHTLDVRNGRIAARRGKIPKLAEAVLDIDDDGDVRHQVTSSRRGFGR